MVLLTILALGMLTLSTITLRQSGGEAGLLEARANARLGMMIAISQLQKSLGPDQRVTATADLQFPSANMPKWVGVYGNKKNAGYTLSPGAIPNPDGDPVLLNWLVSGNEGVTFAASTTGSTFGQITTPPGSIPFTPDQSVNLSSSPPKCNGQNAAILVGSSSVANVSEYVAAPLVKIGTTGNYAYWVSDEGVKARIDLRDNFRQQAASSGADEAKAYSFVIAQRSGIEMMRKDSDISGQIGDDYDPTNKDIAKLFSPGELPLLSANLKSPTKARFHDITAYSKSVIADTYAGGLRQDMTSAIFAKAGPADSAPLFTPLSASTFGIPTWGHLRSWAQVTAPLQNPPPQLSTVQPYVSSPPQTRFGPVISVATLGVGLLKSGNGYMVTLFPAVTLWNPYTVAIPQAKYELGLRVIPGTAGNDVLKMETAANNTFTGAITTTTGPALSAIAGATGGGYFRFAISGSAIPAGESHVYLCNSGAYAAGTSELVRAPSGSPIGVLTRYLTTNSSITPTSAPSSTSYVRLNSSLGNASGMQTGDRFEAVLTQPAALASGFTGATPVFQALLDMNIGRYAFPNAVRPIATVDTAPLCGIRSTLMMEGRGHTNSSASALGAMNGQERNRWLANHNPVAPYVKRTQKETTFGGGAFSHGCVLWGDNGDTYSMIAMDGTKVNYLSNIGGGQDAGTNAPLLDVLPSYAKASPLLSLGQLQHAELGIYGFGTTYSFGNSVANVDLPRTAQYFPARIAPPGAASPTSYTDPQYDICWHLNRALWDSYFVSGAPASLSQTDIDKNLPLPNARMTYYQRNGTPPAKGNIIPSAAALTESAANLMIAGGFNINSTSVDAWRAILTGTNKLTVPSALANPIYSNTPLNAMVPRFSRDVRTSDAGDASGVLNMWDNSGTYRGNIYRGNRELVLYRDADHSSESASAAQARLHSVAQELAQRIVNEIRLRGPFLSLGQFVNRKLVSSDLGIRGTLQAAIDKTSISGSGKSVNPDSCTSGADLGASQTYPSGWDQELYLGSPLTEVGHSANQRAAMAPKQLTQADVLSTIGPEISARSDTFVIRSYGESLSSDGKTIQARAWCETVVQRVPDYMDPANAASVKPSDLSTPNKQFGRRFLIVSFRWLSPNEI